MDTLRLPGEARLSDADGSAGERVTVSSFLNCRSLAELG